MQPMSQQSTVSFGAMGDLDLAHAVRPIQDRVVIVREGLPDRHGLIALPESAARPVNQGRVISTGPGRVSKKGKLIPMTARVGDRVMFAPPLGGFGSDEWTAFVVVPDADVLAVIET